MAEGNIQQNESVENKDNKPEEKKKLQVNITEPEHDKYEGIKKDIADQLRSYEMQYFMQDKPIPFKGLTIYPVTVRDYEIFFICSSCLTLNKLEAGVAGLKMTNLDYLISKTRIEGDEGAMWAFRLQKLCELVFHIQNGLKCQKEECGNIMSYTSPEFLKFVSEIQEMTRHPENIKPDTPKPSLKCPKCGGTDFIEMIKVTPNPESPKHYQILINGQKLTSKDFDLLRYLILFQNLPDYRDDSHVDPAIKKDYEERIRIESQRNGNANAHASIEKKIVALSVTTNYKFEEIYNMTLRKFSIALKTVEDLTEYRITKTAMMSGFVDAKKIKLEHWIYKTNKDMYGDSYKTTDQAQAEVAQASV